jgi:hypothetical protein
MSESTFCEGQCDSTATRLCLTARGCDGTSLPLDANRQKSEPCRGSVNIAGASHCRCRSDADCSGRSRPSWVARTFLVPPPSSRLLKLRATGGRGDNHIAGEYALHTTNVFISSVGQGLQDGIASRKIHRPVILARSVSWDVQFTQRKFGEHNSLIRAAATITGFEQDADAGSVRFNPDHVAVGCWPLVQQRTVMP